MLQMVVIEKAEDVLMVADHYILGLTVQMDIVAKTAKTLRLLQKRR